MFKKQHSLPFNNIMNTISNWRRLYKEEQHEMKKYINNR